LNKSKQGMLKRILNIKNALLKSSRFNSTIHFARTYKAVLEASHRIAHTQVISEYLVKPCLLETVGILNWYQYAKEFVQI
jgi:hypothetical protein